MNELSSNNYSLCESSDKLDPNVLNVVFDMRYILAFNFNKTFLTVFEIFANNPLSPLKKKQQLGTITLIRSRWMTSVQMYEMEPLTSLTFLSITFH